MNENTITCTNVCVFIAGKNCVNFYDHLTAEHTWKTYSVLNFQFSFLKKSDREQLHLVCFPSAQRFSRLNLENNFS